MAEYKAPLRDMRFALHEVLQVTNHYQALNKTDINTDLIIPARYLKSVTFDGLEQFVFIDERSGSASAERTHGLHPFDAPHYQGAAVLLVTSNFGCGSSREHAPQALLFEPRTSTDQHRPVRVGPCWSVVHSKRR